MTEQQIARLASGVPLKPSVPLRGADGVAFRIAFERGERAAFEDRHPPRRRDPPWYLSGEALRGWVAGYTPRNPQWHVLPSTGGQ